MIKIISGGQTGVDRMGLEVARELGLETGGYVPKGYITENGPDFSLKEFNMIESDSTSYNVRTCLNIRNSDATVIFGDIKRPGTRYTLRILNTDNKLHIINPSIEELSNFIKSNNIKVLNIAGNRSSLINKELLLKYKQIFLWGIVKSGKRIEVNEKDKF